MKPILTVLIPVLNGMPYLPEMLASLESQTFQNFEVLLWDNGSSDGTVAEAQKWIPSRLSGRIITEQPLPLHECLARLVCEANTEFCVRMDADDICLPERLQKQVDFLDKHPKIVALGSQAQLIDRTGNSLGFHEHLPTAFSDILSQMLVVNALLHPSIIFRRAQILQAGNYAMEQPCEDYDLWLKAADFGKLENLSDSLLYYRQHPDSILAQAKLSRQLEEPNLACVQRHCQRMFNLSPALYGKLRKKQHPLALLPLLKAAAQIAKKTGVSRKRVLCSPSFLWSARCLTGSNDCISRLAWWILSRLEP